MSKSKPVKETAQTTIPAWLSNASQGNINYAASLPDVVPYTGTGVAPATGNQLTAFDLARGNVGAGTAIAMPAVGGATNAMNFAAPVVGEAEIRGLLNPYQDTVVQNTVSELERARNAIQMRENAAAASARAWGSDRHGVVDAERERNFYDTVGKTVGDLNYRGWDAATNAALANATNRLNAGGLNLAGTNALANIGKSIGDMGWQDIAGLLTTGGAERDIAQQGATFDYNEFIRRIQSPYQKLAGMVSATSGAPHDSTTTKTSEVHSNALGPILGLGLGLASLPMGGGVSFGGGLLKGLLG